MTNGSNRLPELAAEIRHHHAGAEEAALAAAQHAIAAGERLIEAKSLLRHGTWLPFLKESGIPERTAQRYMVLAKSGVTSDTVSDLGGISAALRFLRLREKATADLKTAEAAAREGKSDDESLPPLERAIDIMSEMAAMFPPYDLSPVGGAA